MRRFLFLLICGNFLSACSQQLQDFVRSGPQRVDLTPNSSPIGIKVSPGANIVSGSQVTARFAITPTNRNLQGQALQAKISLQQSRPAN